jgi:hypothetical protein
VALVLLAVILYSLDTWRTGASALDQLTAGSAAASDGDADAGADAGAAAVATADRPRRFLPPPERLRANTLSDPAAGADFGTLRGLGRSLFGDYLLAVEVAGTLLVAAAVGAIAIAPPTPPRIPSQARMSGRMPERMPTRTSRGTL